MYDGSPTATVCYNNVAEIIPSIEEKNATPCKVALDPCALLQSQGTSLVRLQHQLFWRIPPLEDAPGPTLSLIYPCSCGWSFLCYIWSKPSAAVLAAILRRPLTADICERRALLLKVETNPLKVHAFEILISMTKWVVYNLISCCCCCFVKLSIAIDSNNWPSCLFLWFFSLQMITQDSF